MNATDRKWTSTADKGTLSSASHKACDHTRGLRHYFHTWDCAFLCPGREGKEEHAAQVQSEWIVSPISALQRQAARCAT